VRRNGRLVGKDSVATVGGSGSVEGNPVVMGVAEEEGWGRLVLSGTETLGLLTSLCKISHLMFRNQSKSEHCAVEPHLLSSPSWL